MRYLFFICVAGLLGISQLVSGQNNEAVSDEWFIMRNGKVILTDGIVMGKMNPDVRGITGKVIDGFKGGKGIPYAQVYLINEKKRKKDTVKLTCDVLGLFHWGTSRVPAKLKIRVEATGFKTLEWNCGQDEGNTLAVRMARETEKIDEKLNEVIITAQKVYMVVKGDTLAYPAGPFTTFDGNVVADLLKQLPGVSMENDQIRVNGEPISIIRVDGRDFDPSLRDVLFNIWAENLNRNKRD